MPSGFSTAMVAPVQCRHFSRKFVYPLPNRLTASESYVSPKPVTLAGPKSFTQMRLRDMLEEK